MAQDDLSAATPDCESGVSTACCKALSQSGHRCAPLLRWAGSKKRQFRALSQFFPSTFSGYIEPFAGSAAFLFRLAPGPAAINDVNVDLMSFYREARARPVELYRGFSSIPRNRPSYESARASFNGIATPFRRAVLFYYLNRNCFNGIYRVNKAGNFNVPFSDSRVSRYPTQDEFIHSTQLLQNVRIYCGDFERFCLKAVMQHDFVYLDPPYYDSGRRLFREYSTAQFDTADLGRLRQLLHEIHRRKAKFLLTLPHTAESQGLADEWTSSPLNVLRTIAGDPGSRRKETELVIRNYEPQTA